MDICAAEGEAVSANEFWNLDQQITETARKLRHLRKLKRAKNRVVRGLGPKRKGIGCRDRDEALKAARGYTDPSTVVRRDGSEVLKGKDWERRKEELRNRSKGMCEMKSILG